MHRSLKEYFRHFINKEQSNWDNLVTGTCFAYNTATHASHNFSPFELLFGRKPNIPSSFENNNVSKPYYNENDYVSELKHNMEETFKIAKENLDLNKEKTKLRYDKSINPKNFNVGDKVQLLDENVRQGRSKKLSKQWTGPYTILEKINDVNLKIKMGRTEKNVHGNKLKHYYESIKSLSILALTK